MKDSQAEFNVKKFLVPYEEFTDDGKTYYDISKLDIFNIMLMCQSKKGIVIIGPKGSGKTTVMRRFVKQNLNEALATDSVKIISVFEEFLSECKSDEEVIEKLFELCSSYANHAVILFFKANDDKTLKAAIRIFDKYSDKIQKECNNSYLKLVIEYNVEDYKEKDQFEKIDLKSFMPYYVEFPRGFKEKQKIYSIMANELSEIYSVKIKHKILLFAIVVIMGYVESGVNLKDFYDCFEMLFAYARKEKQKFITKKLIKKVFYESFDRLAKRSKEEIQRTAYHESGHALFSLINSDYWDLYIVTVIPGYDYNGVTRFNKTENHVNVLKNKQLVINNVAKLLAGREAERLVIYPYNPNKGAHKDLSHAQELVNELIYEYGISETLGNNYVIKKDEPLSETTRRHIEIEKAHILDEATKIAFDKVFKHKNFIEALANKLVSNLVVTGDEAREMWQEHLKELEKNNSNIE